jgi:hypothetical protein
LIHVRIASTYPPAFGLPEESFDLTLPLRDGFASTPAEAHQHILEALATEDVFEVPAAHDPLPYRLSPDVVRLVAVW